MGAIAVTGSASGIGAALVQKLEGAGRRVIGIDLQNSEVTVDLSTADGRTTAISSVIEISGGVLDGLVTCAGLGGLPGRPGSLLAEVNYFGTVELLAGLRPALAAGRLPSAVAIASNSTTIQPGIPMAVVDACLAGDREAARAQADMVGAVSAYPATKVAVSRWVRRQATRPEWIGSGIRLNAVAPGLVETALTGEQRSDPEMAPLIDMLPIPLGRGGRPDEIAAVIEFLLGEGSTFFCGSVLLADGGTEALLRPDDWPMPWDLDVAGAISAFGEGNA